MKNSYNFTKFKFTNKRSVNQSITIRKTASLGFPRRFYDNNKIYDFKYVVLYQDKEKNAIGIQFTNDEREKNRFTIVHLDKGYGAAVSAHSFFRQSEIDPIKYAGSYSWEKVKIDDETELYVIGLGELSREDKK